MTAVRQSIDERLQQLYDEHGCLTPDIVIEDARDTESPLHEQFNWDVQEAAMEAWRATARRLIRTVKVQVTIEDTKWDPKARTILPPIYVRDPSRPSAEQGYARVADLRSDRDRAMAALMYEIDRADAAIRRAREVADALGLLDEVNIVSSALSTVRRKAKGAA